MSIHGRLANTLALTVAAIHTCVRPISLAGGAQNVVVGRVTLDAVLGYVLTAISSRRIAQVKPRGQYARTDKVQSMSHGIRSFLAIATIAAIAGFGAEPHAAASDTMKIDDPAQRVHQTVLANGVTVLTLEDPSTPVVSFQMWVQVGSRDEGYYTGVAHLFEHMMFKGSTHIGPEEHARLVQARGGNLNAFTSRDITVYFEDVTAETLPLVIDLEAERVAHLDISEATLASERQVVIEERRLRTDDSPEGLAFEALTALAWTALPYRWPVIGWRSDLDAVTVKECRRFFHAYYAPNNIVLAIVGNFDAALALARIERTFGRMPAVEDIPRNPTTEPPQRGERRGTVYFDVRSPILTVAWHAPASGHQDSTPLDVMGQILSQGRSSRLYGALVYGAQKALFADARYWELKDAGLFYAVAGVRPDASIDEVEELFFDEITRLREEGVTDAEVAKAKRQLEVMLVNGLRTTHSLAARVARDFVTFGRVRPLEERLEDIHAVTSADVRRVARKYLMDEHRNVVRVVRPPEAKTPESSELVGPHIKEKGASR